MSLNKIWMQRALQSRQRFAESHVTHMYLRMNTVGLVGVYCRTPALDAFDYADVAEMALVTIGNRGDETGVARYAITGAAARQKAHAPTCTGCRFAWEAYVNWWREYPQPTASGVDESAIDFNKETVKELFGGTITVRKGAATKVDQTKFTKVKL